MDVVTHRSRKTMGYAIKPLIVSYGLDNNTVRLEGQVESHSRWGSGKAESRIPIRLGRRIQAMIGLRVVQSILRGRTFHNSDPAPGLRHYPVGVLLNGLLRRQNRGWACQVIE